MNRPRMRVSAMAAVIAAAFPVAVLAADDTAALKQQIDQLRKEVSELRALVQGQSQQTATRKAKLPR